MKKRFRIISVILVMVIAFGTIRCDALVYVYNKLSRPTMCHPKEIARGGSKSCFYCSNKKHYLEIKMKIGDDDYKTKFKVYRRAAGSKKYKKIKVKNEGHVWSDFDWGSNKTRNVFMDYTAKAGKTYYYKVKLYRKQGKKTIYSPMSKPFKMKMTSDTGIYKVKSITKPSLGVNQVTVKVTSNKGNANTYFPSYGDEWTYRNGKESYDCKLVAYSFNNKKWIANKKGTLKPGKSIYLKFQFDKDDEIDYKGATGKKSRFTTSEGMDYWGHYKNEITDQYVCFDLISKKGKAEIDALDDM